MPTPSESPTACTATSVATTQLRKSLEALTNELKEEKAERQLAEAEIARTRKQLEMMEKLLSLSK